MIVIIQKIRYYQQLTKFTLSVLVSFSCVMCYLLSDNPSSESGIIIRLALGGFFIVAAANTFNQIIEKKSDACMSRTKNRPVASGKLSEFEATIVGVLYLLLGTYFLSDFSFNVLWMSWLSVGLYAWVYTPMKRYSSFSVIVGAIPGALPCLIGWVAGGGTKWAMGWSLFAFQFIWQFPHFWAIAWLSYKDYEKAGFRLLPTVQGPSKYAAMQSILYSMVLIPLGILPFFLEITGLTSAIIILIANLILLILCIQLYLRMNNKAARMIMFASYLHLLIYFFVLIFDKQ